MASKPALDNFSALAKRFQSIDKERLLRPGLGEESLKVEFGPLFETFAHRVDFMLKYASDVADVPVGNAASALDRICQLSEAHAKRNNPEYVNQKANFVSQVSGLIQEFNQHYPPFAVAALEARGFLTDEGLRQEYSNTLANLKAETDKLLAHVKVESTRAIEEAKRLADDIEQRARRTAQKISVKDAQEQFSAAQSSHTTQVIIWAFLSLLSVITFIFTALYFAKVTLPQDWHWHVIYYTAIRVTVLTAVGALATFSLRILRAHLHMSEHNKHRQRVANSIASFVESAVTPEQRDLILAQLVEAVIAFGHSGLIQRDDDTIAGPKMTIDSIMRTIAPPK